MVEKYVNNSAIGRQGIFFLDESGNAVAVSENNPLPVTSEVTRAEFEAVVSNLQAQIDELKGGSS